MRKILVFATLALATWSASGQDLQSNPVQQAIMNTYDRLIAEDPSDYVPYYRRAADYYRLDQYLRALSDINQAISLTPANQKEDLFGEYVLRGNIYLMTDRPAEALPDFDAALAIDPTDFNTIHQKANTEFLLGKYEDATAGYKRMQALSARSPEALFGLARIAIKERNYGKANEYADQAVKLNSGESDVYVTRALVRKDLGNNTGAVQDLIAAISIDTNNRALSELVIIGSEDYPATITALSDAIKEAPNALMFRYLRAEIEMLNYRYRDAITDFNVLLDGNQSSPGIYQSLAQCQYALGNYAQAAVDIEFALGSEPDNVEFLLTLSQIRRAQWRPEDALTTINKAIEKDASFGAALYEKGLVLVDLKKYSEACDAVGESMLYDGEDTFYFLTRAWILNEYLNQPIAAKTYYKRVIEQNDLTDPADAFAELFTGNQEKAFTVMQNILAADKSNPYMLYLATCLYAQAGQADKALDYMEQALKAGYANYYDWTRCDDSRVNVAPLRDNQRFNDLLTQYKSIF